MNQTETESSTNDNKYFSRRIPMLGIPLKVTDEVNFVEELYDFINNKHPKKTNYHKEIENPEHPEEPSYHKDNIKTLNRLRQDILGAGKDMIGKNILYKYMKELEKLGRSFVTSKDDVFKNVKFKWYIL